MKKTYRITGIDCPNCAKAIEGVIAKESFIEKVSLDYAKSKLYLVLKDENAEENLEKVIKTVKLIESNAEITDENEKSVKKSEKKFVFDLILFIVGVILGALAVFLKDLPLAVKYSFMILSALFIGYKTYFKALKLLLKGVVNENLLVTISVIGALIIGETFEGLMVIILYTIGKFLEDKAVEKSKKNIEELMERQSDFIIVIRDGKEIKALKSEINVGEHIIVKPGEIVGLDGKIVKGFSYVDVKHLTGESVPVFLKEGDEIASGSVVIDGMVEIQTTVVYAESTVKRITDLIINAESKKSKTETIVSKMAKWYTFAVMFFAVVVFLIVYIVLGDLSVAVYRGLIFLVVSCPCAFAISVPLTYFSGIGNASKKGVLVKGSAYLDNVARADIVVFDKTGTITTGAFTVEKVEALNGFTEEDVLRFTRMGERYSIHPIAKAIMKNADTELTPVENFTEIKGKGVKYVFEGKEYFVGKSEEDDGFTTVILTENGELKGKVYLEDSVKEEAVSVISDLKKAGIKTVILSGDNEKAVEKAALKAGVDEFTAKLTPEEKYEKINEYKKQGKKVIYVGDGMNDAPSLALADVGISMGLSGSPLTIEASDAVIVDDDLKTIPAFYKTGKFTKKIVKENVIFALLIKIVFLTLGAVGITGMLPAVFADVGVTLITILNGMRALYYGTTKQGR